MTRLRRTLSYTVIVSSTLFFLLFSCGSGRQDTVAVIDGEKIPVEYFLWTQQLNNFKNRSLAEQTETLEEFYHKLLRSHEAQRIDFDGKERLEWEIFYQKRTAILQSMYQMMVLDPIVSDEDIREAYNKLQENRTLRHILISHRESMNFTHDRTKSEALTLARDLKRRIESGDLPFEEAARKYSNSPRAESGGNLGVVTWGERDEDFQRAAWNLPLQTLSDPVETNYGYHLIEVIDIDSTDLGSYAEAYPRIRQSLLTSRRNEIDQRAQEALRTVMTATNFSLNDTILSSLSSQLYRLYQQASHDANANTPTPDLVNLFNTIEYTPIGSINGNPISREEFSEFLQGTQNYRFNGLAHANDLYGRIRSHFQQDAFLQYAEQQNVPEYDDTKYQLRSIEDMAYSRAYLNNVVLKNFPPTEDSLRAFYERVKTERYADPAQVRVREIYVSDKNIAHQLQEQLRNGSDFASLAREYSERDSSAKAGGDLGWFSTDRYGPIGDAAKTMKPGEIQGPFRLGVGWSIIELTEKSPVTPDPFEEIKKTVRSDYIRQYRPQLIQQNIEQLEQKYTSRLNYEILDAI